MMLAFTILLVNVVFTWSVPMEVRIAKKFGKVKLPCPFGKTATRNLTQADFRWYYNDKLLLIKPIFSDQADFMGNDKDIILSGNRLILRDLRHLDAGRYSCHVLRPGRERWHNYTVLVTSGHRPFHDHADVYYPDNYHPDDYYADDYYADNFYGDPVPAPDHSSAKYDDAECDEVDAAAGAEGAAGANATVVLRAPFFCDATRLRTLELVAAGGQVTMRCPARGHPPPVVRWLYEGRPVKAVLHLADRVTVGHGWLRLRRASRFDEGNFTCVAENGLGSVQHSVALETTFDSLLTKPELESAGPRNVTALPGADVAFQCAGTWDWDMDLFWVFSGNRTFHVGGMADLSRYNRHAISQHEKHYITDLNAQRLTVLNVSAADTGHYTCIMYNSLGLDYARAYLNVVTDASRLASSVGSWNASARPGATVALRCPAGRDADSVFWLRPANGSLQLETAGQLELARRQAVPGPQQDDASRFNASDPGRLVISNVTMADSGHYVCVVHSAWDISFTWTHLAVSAARAALQAADVSVWAQWAPWLVPATLAALAVSGLLSAALCRRHRRDRRQIQTLTKRVLVEPSESGLVPVVRIEPCEMKTGAGTAPTYVLPLDPAWEVARARLQLTEPVGEGCFGRVVRARLSQNDGPALMVAVKMLKEDCSDSDMMDLVSEMEVMKKIGRHVNIVSLIGTCTRDGTPLVIMEYAAHGNLRTYLRERREMSTYERAFDVAVPSERDLVSFGYQVARGMEYLTAMKCLHRDLAARNVLVSDNSTLKIADFGLARDIQAKDYYRKITDGRLPVKWMAPEALSEQLYTAQSDVWSFGVLLWEIMSMGSTPYPGFSDVSSLVCWLQEGQRMERPACCPCSVYDVMLDCWRLEARARPPFGVLVERLGDILAALSPEEYVAMGPPPAVVAYANVLAPSAPQVLEV